MRFKTFSLGGHDIKVKYSDTVRSPDTGAEVYGLANPMQNMICVATKLQGHDLSEDVILHSFFHELAHFFMILMGEHELNQNEDFIDLLGAFLHQWWKTKKMCK